MLAIIPVWDGERRPRPVRGEVERYAYAMVDGGPSWSMAALGAKMEGDAASIVHCVDQERVHDQQVTRSACRLDDGSQATARECLLDDASDAPMIAHAPLA